MAELHRIKGTDYMVKRERLREVFPYSEANPLMWFGFDLRSRDVVVAGVRTRHECVALLTDDANERST
jgi:hypothetical protein